MKEVLNLITLHITLPPSFYIVYDQLISKLKIITSKYFNNNNDNYNNNMYLKSSIQTSSIDDI